MNNPHRELTDIAIVILTFTLAVTVMVAVFMTYTIWQVNNIMSKVNRLSDSARMAAMVASGTKGFTEGLGSAIAAITCKLPEKPIIPPLVKKSLAMKAAMSHTADSDAATAPQIPSPLT
jgi:hypothetical protein